MEEIIKDCEKIEIETLENKDQYEKIFEQQDLKLKAKEENTKKIIEQKSEANAKRDKWFLQKQKESQDTKYESTTSKSGGGWFSSSTYTTTTRAVIPNYDTGLGKDVNFLNNEIDRLT